jgi:hypothetical protein
VLSRRTSPSCSCTHHHATPSCPAPRNPSPSCISRQPPGLSASGHRYRQRFGEERGGGLRAVLSRLADHLHFRASPPIVVPARSWCSRRFATGKPGSTVVIHSSAPRAESRHRLHRASTPGLPCAGARCFGRFAAGKAWVKRDITRGRSVCVCRLSAGPPFPHVGSVAGRSCRRGRS